MKAHATLQRIKPTSMNMKPGANLVMQLFDDGALVYRNDKTKESLFNMQYSSFKDIGYTQDGLTLLMHNDHDKVTEVRVDFIMHEEDVSQVMKILLAALV